MKFQKGIIVTLVSLLVSFSPVQVIAETVNSASDSSANEESSKTKEQETATTSSSQSENVKEEAVNKWQSISVDLPTVYSDPEGKTINDNIKLSKNQLLYIVKKDELNKKVAFEKDTETYWMDYENLEDQSDVVKEYQTQDKQLVVFSSKYSYAEKISDVTKPSNNVEKSTLDFLGEKVNVLGRVQTVNDSVYLYVALATNAEEKFYVQADALTESSIQTEAREKIVKEFKVADNGAKFTNVPDVFKDAEVVNDSLEKMPDTLLSKEKWTFNNGQSYYLFEINGLDSWMNQEALKEIKSDTAEQPKEALEQTPKAATKAAGVTVVSQWGTNYNMRIVVGGHGIYNQPKGLAGTITYGSTSSHLNRAVKVTYAKLLSNKETYYRYEMDGRTYWTISDAFTNANAPYELSQWPTNYSMRIAVAGHGIYSQPKGLPGTVTYGSTSNHLNRVVKVTYAKLLSNNETYYRYEMDGRTYWTISDAFANSNAPYELSQWPTNYDLRIAAAGHGIYSQPKGLPGTVTYGSTSNHLNRAVKVTYAKLLSNKETYYRYEMDGRTYWTISDAFVNANAPYVISQWPTANYQLRIANKGYSISNQPAVLPNTVTYGNTSSHIGRPVVITYAKLVSNNETYYRYEMDGRTYWSNSKAFGPRVSAAKVINIANKYIGVTSNPPGTRNNIFNTAFYGHPVSSTTSRYDWCAVFVWYVMREAGIEQEYYGGGKTRYTDQLLNWYKANGRYSTTPKAGDLIFYSWTGNTIDHVALVESVGNDGYMTVINGNDVGDNVTKGRVAMNNYKIVGYGRPRYN